MVGNVLSERKYDKYFISEGVSFYKAKTMEKFQGSATPHFTLNDGFKDAFPDASLRGNGMVFVKPHVLVTEVHLHDFDEWLFFYGSNMQDIDEFDAEVEINMGDEGEIYMINNPTILYVPSGMKHCPLNFKVINKPVFFFHIRATT